MGEYQEDRQEYCRQCEQHEQRDPPAEFGLSIIFLHHAGFFCAIRQGSGLREFRSSSSGYGSFRGFRFRLRH